jgi:hypothetical protein
LASKSDISADRHREVHNENIFYHPAPIRENATSASGNRPFKMLFAFRNAGFTVDTVCGYPQERANSSHLIKENVAQGIK